MVAPPPPFRVIGSKVVPIDSVKVEKLAYVRTLQKGLETPFWVTTHIYKRHMEAGIVFPNIVLAKIKGQHILVDGYHRLLARKSLGYTDITADFVRCRNLDEVYIEALRRNVVHGQNLDAYEIATAIARLRQKHMTYADIGLIMGLKPADIRKMETQRVQYTDHDFVIIKPILRDTATGDITKQEQDIYVDRTQQQLLKQVIQLLETDRIDVHDKEVVALLQKLSMLLYKLVGVDKKRK